MFKDVNTRALFKLLLPIFIELQPISPLTVRLGVVTPVSVEIAPGTLIAAGNITVLLESQVCIVP